MKETNSKTKYNKDCGSQALIFVLEGSELARFGFDMSRELLGLG
jgi:hypothetical protein